MLINLTPHEIVVYPQDAPDVLGEGAPAPLLTIPPSGTVARVAQAREIVGEVGGAPIGLSTFGAPEGLPAPQPGTWYIVSGLLLAAAPARADLLAPAAPVRDGQGRIIGCRGFDTTPAGAAALKS